MIPESGHSASCAFDANGDLDIDGSDLAIFAIGFSPDDLTQFASDFGHTDCTDELPPDPATIAPNLDPTIATTIAVATAFLYTGDNPIQTGMAPGTIEEKRALVLRGSVMNRDSSPLPGVRIYVFNQPEYGRTLTREDGRFDMVINGGGTVIVQYEKAGYLPVQRKVVSPWQDYIQVPQVVMIPKDTVMTTVDLSASAMQVARGSAISDEDGARQATLLIPAGTTAELVMPDGSTQSVDMLTISATEYTVGDQGPAAMPAELPGQTGYTYCVELSAEEVRAAGADILEFNQPVVQYVENFLDFPIGGIVPVGSYDRQKGVWSPSENGRIIGILSVTAGKADLDVDGSGTPADSQTLLDLGVTEAEREQLASLYTPGQSLWRIPITHFSTWDANWGWGPPLDALQPILDLLAWLHDLFKDDCEPCETTGSIIECQNQVLGETIDIAGTPFTLNYRSNRVPGRLADYTLDIPLSEETLPASLKRIDLEIEIAGQFHQQSFGPLPDQQVTFIWDGKDAYGRTLTGTQPVSIRVGYVYDGYYQEPADLKKAFGYRGSGISISVLAREEITFWQSWQSSLGPWDARSQGLGGWTLSAHHAYDPVGRILYPGYGGRRKASGSEGIIDTVAGGGLDDCYEGCPASELKMDRPYGIAMAPDGSVYIADTFRSRIRVFRPDGTAETVAPTESFRTPMDVALDALGNLYVADYGNHRIVRVAPDGTAEDFAGTGVAGFSGDGGPAIEAQFRAPACIVLGPDGSLYISDYNNHRIRQITPDGIVRTIAGTGVAGFSGDGGPAIEAQINGPGGIDASPDGSIVFADENNHRIRNINLEGIITTISGGGTRNYADGLQATDINMKVGWPIFGSDGSIYHTAVDHRACRVSPDGVISTVAGSGTAGFSGDGGPAAAAGVSLPLGKALGHSRNLLIADRNNHRLREVKLPFSVFGNGAITIPSEDGSQLYRFDADGRHLETVHALTGALLYHFTYDENGLLVGIEDGDGNLTSIERAGDDNPTAIIAPFGQLTTLLLDANGYLSDITNPENEAFHSAYSADGLMTSFRDPENHTSEFTYDSRGRLLKDENAAGGYSELDRVTGKNTYTVSLSTAEGRTTSYQTEVLATNDIRKVNTFPDGTQNESIEKPDGGNIVTFADGMVVESVEGPDPRFEMLAPIIEKLTLRTPGGLVFQTVNERTGVFSDPEDPTTLESLTHTSTINGHLYTSAYDAAGRSWTHTSPEGRQTIGTLDGQGRPSTFQATDLATVSLAYDSRGRIETASYGARATDFAYDGVTGFLQSVTNPLGESSSLTHDSASRTISLTRPDTTNWGYQWDDNGNLITLTEPNGSTRHAFTYTPTDLLQTYTSPLNAVETFAYNKEDQLVTRQFSSGDMLEWVYDAGGRLTAFKTPQGDHTFGYNAASGQLIQAVSRDGQQIDYTYDGSLATRIDWTGAVTGSVGYTYNNDLLISQIDYAGASLVVTHDNDGLLTGVGTVILTRDAGNGLVTGISNGSFAISYTRNTYGEIATVTASHGATLYDVATTYDDLGRIAQKTETIGGSPRTWSYDYDAVGQLIQVVRDAVIEESYDYDDRGNRIAVTNTLTGVTLTGSDFNYDADNKLLAAGTTTYGYDADGRLHQVVQGSDTTTYGYNTDGTLASVDLPDARRIAYLYDHRGRRIARSDNSVRTHAWLYGDGLMPIAEYDGGGSVTKAFIYAGSPTPVAYVQGGSTYHIVSDHLGSPRLVVDGSGTVIKKIDFDSFGNVITDSNPGLSLCFGFAGGLADPDHELIRFGARDYQPSTGRWTARDPIFFNGGLNLYGYVGGDPINRVDREGFQLSGGVTIETIDSNLIAEIKSILLMSFENEDLQCKYRSSSLRKRTNIRYALNLLTTKPAEALYAYGGNLNTGEWFKLSGLSDIWCPAILGNSQDSSKCNEDKK